MIALAPIDNMPQWRGGHGGVADGERAFPRAHLVAGERRPALTTGADDRGAGFDGVAAGASTTSRTALQRCSAAAVHNLIRSIVGALGSRHTIGSPRCRSRQPESGTGSSPNGGSGVKVQFGEPSSALAVRSSVHPSYDLR